MARQCRSSRLSGYLIQVLLASERGGLLGIMAVDLSKGRKRRTFGDRDPLNTTIAPVIALDPGQTTGWSLMIANPEALIDCEAKVLENINHHQHGQVSSLWDEHTHTDGESIAVDDIWNFIEQWPEAAIVMEDFVIRIHDRSRQFLSPVRIMARLDYLLWKNGRFAFRQSPADAKNTCSDVRLKEWGFYDSYGGLNHARDADRHALLFLRKCKQNHLMRREAWPQLFGPEGKYA